MPKKAASRETVFRLSARKRALSLPAIMLIALSVFGTFLLSGGVGASPVSAQQSSVPADGGEDGLKIGAGPSRFVSFWDEIDQQTATGVSVPIWYAIGGLGIGPRVSYWPDVRGEPLWAIDLELISAIRLGPVAPHIFTAVGWTTKTSAFFTNGSASMVVGAGASGNIWEGVGLRGDAAIRQDGGVWNANYSLAATFNVAPARTERGHPERPRVVLQTWFMRSVTGEWRIIEPVYSLEFRSAITRNWGGALGVSVEHWQLPSGSAGPGYRWDTRSLSAHWSIGWQPETLPLRISVGPSVSSMGEGPELGGTLGALARLEFRPRRWPLVAGAGAWWIQRSGAVSSEYMAANQLLILFQLGIEL